MSELSKVRPHCPVKDVMSLYPRDWDQCECGWPKVPCKEFYPEYRWTLSTADIALRTTATNAPMPFLREALEPQP